MVSLPHALLDMGRDLLVAMLIVGFFSKEVFGSFNHSYMVLRLPLMFIGVSIGQVFFNRCSEMINKGEEIYGLLRRTVLLLLGLSIVPFVLIMLFGEPLFELVFGSNWGESGQYSQIMAAWLMLNFMHSPISNIPVILNRQKEYFFFGLISTAIQIIGFGVLPFVLGNGKEDFIQLLWIVSVLMALYHVLIILFSLKYAKIGLIRKS
jgi:O-antigen/teichoic acid export membrane protein